MNPLFLFRKLFGFLKPKSPQTRLSISPELASAIEARKRYQDADSLIDLNKAIEQFQNLLNSSEPSFIISFNLGFCVDARYQRTHNPADLDQAIQSFQQANFLIPPDDPNRARFLIDYSSSRGRRYRNNGDRSDIDQAIQLAEQAIALTPPGVPDRAAILTSLSMDLRARYESTRSIGDIDQAIQLAERAIALTPHDASAALATLAAVTERHHRARYERTLNLVDLDQAIALAQRAVDLIPPAYHMRSAYLSSLASDLAERFKFTLVANINYADLEQAIQYQQEAVNITQIGSPERAERLSELGSYLLRRYEYTLTKNQSDLVQAIAFAEEALALIPLDSPNISDHMNNLARSLTTRYREHGDLADLDRAIDNYQQALDRSSPTSPNLPSRFNNFAHALHDRYLRVSDASDLESAMRNYRMACLSGPHRDLDIVLTSSQRWGNWALGRGAWSEAVEAFRYGLAAVEEILLNQPVRADKESWLFQARDLNTDAAYALARTGDLATAITVLEQGRARLLSEALEVIVPFSLISETPDSAASDSALNAELPVASPGTDGAPGAGVFSQSAPFEEIHYTLTAPLPDGGQPVAAAYLVTTDAGGLALLVHPTGVEPVWLELTKSDLDKMLLRYDDGRPAEGYLLSQVQGNGLDEALQDVLPRLGELLMAPIAAALEGVLPGFGADRETPAVILIPTGLLAQLPLHAATYRVNGNDQAFLDRYAVIYAPSARAFGYCRRTYGSIQHGELRLLAVGNPLPTSGSSLTYSHAEANELASLFDDGSAKVLCETDATRRAVEAHLGSAWYIHFACHGFFDPMKPLESGLLLSRNEMLTLRDVRSHTRFSHTRLVVLSACQTAIADFIRLPDEAIGLPTGFVQAGVPGVVGTLWPVNDLSTALLLVTFYEAHLRGNVETGERALPPYEALRQAQQWLRQVTNRELTSYLSTHQHLESACREAQRQLPEAFISEEIYRFGSGNDPDARPFAHPFYWAPFVFVGV